MDNDEFDNFGDGQLIALDEMVEKISKNGCDDAEDSPRKRQKIDPTAEQLELAAALFNDDDDGSAPSLDHLAFLLSHFKHDRFREKQWEIIRTVMIEKRDVCAVMATGYGKSLCFQVRFFSAFVKKNLCFSRKSIFKYRSIVVHSFQPYLKIVWFW